MAGSPARAANATATQARSARRGAAARRIQGLFPPAYPSAAAQSFEQFDRLLPGDPGIAFLRGVSYEGAGNQRAAAENYARFLRSGGQGRPAEYSASRLKAWGYTR